MLHLPGISLSISLKLCIQAIFAIGGASTEDLCDIDEEEGETTVSDEETNTDTESIFTDADGDGFTSDIDCVDDDASIHPMADELCDGVDNNCDGVTDLDAIDRTELYVDSDGDGYGAGDSLLVCSGTPNMVSTADDCDRNFFYLCALLTLQ